MAANWGDNARSGGSFPVTLDAEAVDLQAMSLLLPECWHAKLTHVGNIMPLQFSSVQTKQNKGGVKKSLCCSSIVVYFIRTNIDVYLLGYFLAGCSDFLESHTYSF